MGETIYDPPKTIRFPSDIHGIRIKDGKEEIKVVCSDNEYHWVDFCRYKSEQ